MTGAHPPIPADTGTLLVFGGSFDPPTRAHIELPRFVRDRIGADWMLFVPAGQSPLKGSGPVAAAADRVAMLEAALRGEERASITTIEMEREGPSWTVDTLRALRNKLPARTHLRLLIGADQARQFHRWREPREVIALAEPVVVARATEGVGVNGADDKASLLREMSAHWSAQEMEAWSRRIVEAPAYAVSSTAVRRLLREKGLCAEAEAMLAEGVAGVIGARGVYG